jgi:hypothetical protein
MCIVALQGLHHIETHVDQNAALDDGFAGWRFVGAAQFGVCE